MSNHREYKQTTLDNGLTVHSLYVPNSSKNYTEVLVKSGSAVEQTTKTGVAHYLEHMFSYGSHEWGEKDIISYFQDLGGNYNFTTSPTMTNYFAYAVPHKTHEFLNRVSTVLVNPAFTKEHVDLERRPIITEAVSELDNFENNTSYHVFQSLFPDHRISIPNIGRIEDIENITYEDLKNYYDATYVSENMHIISTGNVNHDDLVKQAEVLFADLPRGKARLPFEPLSPKEGTNLCTKQWQRLDVGIGFKIPEITDAHTTQYQIVSQLLSRQINNNLRNKHKLVYGASVDTLYLPTIGCLALNVSMDPKNLDAVLDKTMETLQEFFENTGRKELDIFLAHEEEFIAENINNPRTLGSFLSSNILMERDYVPYDVELKTAQSMTKDDICARAEEILSSAYVGTVIGSVNEAPDIENRIEKLRSDLGIKELKPKAGLKMDFSIN